jgi:hypothetical protein
VLKGTRGMDSIVRETCHRVELALATRRGCPSAQPQIADGTTWSMSEIAIFANKTDVRSS